MTELIAFNASQEELPTEDNFNLPDTPEESAEEISPAETAPESDTDEESLKAKALLLWSEHDKWRVTKLAPVLYVLCKTLNAQGKKGNGFRAWLRANKKSKTTAYRWVGEYCEANHKELPWPQKEKVKSTSKTSSHVGQAPPIECSHEPALPMSPTQPSPAWTVAHLSEEAQISMLGIGTLAGVLKDAEELVQSPGEQFRSSLDLFDPSTQEYALFDSLEYNWSPQERSGELVKARAYLVALTAALKALNRETRPVRLQLKAVEHYITRLNDNEPPLFIVVPKKVPLPANELQKEVA